MVKLVCSAPDALEAVPMLRSTAFSGGMVVRSADGVPDAGFRR
ncbi:MAG: hypothetical protein OXP28_13425 [Gammaproteobacteria bacterium]|nr:hypothetical protein [Gammaproteobacteria bacterium]